MAQVRGATAAGSADWGKTLVDDLTELRDQLIALLVTLDADTGVADTDYEATLTPAELTTRK